MSIVAPHPETRIVLSNISWATFEAMVAEKESCGTRFVYDRGVLEIMAPSAEHEWYHRLLGRLVEAFTMERNIAVRTTGATTLKAQLAERGLEPDESYYIASESAVRGCLDLDLERDPPPDLAIEVEISRMPWTSWRFTATWAYRKYGSTTANRCGCACCNPIRRTKPEREVPSCRNSGKTSWRPSLPGGRKATRRVGFVRFTSGCGLST